MISYLIIGLLIGGFIGAAFGIFIASLCRAAGEADEELGYK